MSFVDREEVNKIISEIEGVFTDNNCLPDEKQFILNHIINRMRMSEEKQKMSDLMTSTMSGGFLKSFFKRAQESEKE